MPVDAEPSLQSLDPGAYEIEERPPSSPQGSWRLTSVHCTDSSEARIEPVKVTISGGAQVTCVFTNRFTPRGSIAITKVTQGGVGRTGFEITPLQGTPATYLQSATTTHPGIAAAAHPDTSQDATDHLELGSYRIVEEPPASGPAGRWTLTGVRCNGVDVPFAEGGLVVTLTRHAPAVHCEFTNELQRHPPRSRRPSRPRHRRRIRRCRRSPTPISQATPTAICQSSNVLRRRRSPKVASSATASSSPTTGRTPPTASSSAISRPGP